MKEKGKVILFITSMEIRTHALQGSELLGEFVYDIVCLNIQQGPVGKYLCVCFSLEKHCAGHQITPC